MAREKEVYLGFSERWRNFAKPTIAAVQGRCIAGGLMLVWPCDIIIAGDDAMFLDNTVNMGVPGAEYFNHPWEMGVRKAKELLFTAGWWSAADAHRMGMVNHVVPPADLQEFTLNMANRIAAQPLFALKLAKEAVNTAQDSQGRVTAMQTSFALHQLAHAHNQQLFGMLIDPTSSAAALNEAANAEAETRLANWVTTGRIKAVLDLVEGLEVAPDGLIRLLAGGNRGKVAVLVA